MTDTIYLIVSVPYGWRSDRYLLLSRVKTAVYGNMLSVLCTVGVVVTMYKYGILTFVELWIWR